MNIIESRYNGSYSGGAYVLIAGVHNPKQNTQAFGSDTECMSFWKTVEEEGPILTLTVNNREKEIYVDSGDHPATVFQEFTEFCRNEMDNTISKIITKTLREYPEIEQDAQDNIVNLHKLKFVAESYFESQVNGSISSGLVKDELLNRFLEYDSIPNHKTLSDSDQQELAEFITEFKETHDVSPAFIYSIYTDTLSY